MTPRVGQEVLRADSMTARFGARSVLTSATLRAAAGRVTVLFGRNGAGKSTLLSVAAGLRAADSGVVTFQGTVHLRPWLPTLAREGLFLLPDRDLLSPSMTLRDHFTLFAHRYRRPFVQEAAALVGVRDQLDQSAARCSGGERRRAEVALAWLRGPTCVLADEPYRDVAPAVGEVLSRVFRRMAEDGCAVVVTGHETETLLDLADNIVWCTAGTTYELGTPAQARAHERFQAEYLGPRGTGINGVRDQ
jgi:ABC-type multidrug transport system ATPase subunit